MSVSEFWDSTPRITSLFVEGYLRRRAWAAYHAGAWQSKDVKLADLMPVAAGSSKPKGEAMDPEHLLRMVRRIKRRMKKDFGDGE
jgi:hypothetical protein